MLIVRSFLFNIAFYLNLLIYIIAGFIFIFLPRTLALIALRSWARMSNRLLRLIAGTRTELRGLEHLPKGAALIACKHQSAWETFSLLYILDDAAMVLKKELMWIPFYGWYARRFKMISVDRSAGPSALKSMVKQAKEAKAMGRQVVIFPEGTRRVPGAVPDYKPGIAALYMNLDMPCIPVALNSGLYWPRRKFLRFPGTIVIEFLTPIPQGMTRRPFMAELEKRIEAATAKLVEEGERGE